MYKEIYVLDTRGWPHEQVMEYLQLMLRAIGTGPGSNSKMKSMLDLKSADALRFLLGAPDTWLTTERQLFAEAGYAMSIGYSLDEAHGSWIEGTHNHWLPENPRAHSDLNTAQFDLEFMDSFGLTAKDWGDILNSPTIMDRAKQGADSKSDRLRASFSLLMFGFSRPADFFTAR